MGGSADSGISVYDSYKPGITDDFLISEDYVLCDDLANRFATIIEDLPLLQRQTLVFSFYDHLTYDDIAIITGSDKDVVILRLNYAAAYVKTEVDEIERSASTMHNVAMIHFSEAFCRYIDSKKLAEKSSELIWNSLYEFILSSS